MSVASECGMRVAGWLCWAGAGCWAGAFFLGTLVTLKQMLKPLISLQEGREREGERGEEGRKERQDGEEGK